MKIRDKFSSDIDAKYSYNKYHDNYLFQGYWLIALEEYCPPSHQPRSEAVGETAWQLLQVRTVTSAARKLAVTIKFVNVP